MSNQILMRIYEALSFREAGNLHQKLQLDAGSLETRELLRKAMLKAGLV